MFLTGNNARTVSVASGQTVESNLPVVSINDMNGMEVQAIPGIFMYSFKECNSPSPEVDGPGTLYVSDGQAFYINDGCTFEMNFINQAINDAPQALVTFDVTGAIDNGNPVSSLNVNGGEFEMTLTGAMSIMVGPGDVLSYTSGFLSTPGGSFDNIAEFGIASRGDDGNAQFSVFGLANAPVNVQGPGQLFVGSDSAVFLGEFGSGSTPIGETINEEIVTMTFTFNTVSSTDMTMVTDSQDNPVTIISPNTMVFEVPGASTSTYSSMELAISSTGGQVLNFNDISRFSVFDNNELTTNPTTFSYSSGGTVFVDSTENTAIFVSNTNPSAVESFQMFIPGTETVSYEVETNDDNVRYLMRTSGSPPETESIQTITGSYVMNVGSSETVVYNDNGIEIQTFQGRPRVRIGQVNEFLTNTAMNPSGNFTTSAPTPFRGPGTFSYSRGTGFYTTDSELGSTIGYQSRTAPIPRTEFEATPIGINEVDGENYTVSNIAMTIGGDKVIDFEATSYTTTPDQEIVYANDVVSVHRPTFTGSGEVSFNGGTQVVTYTDRNGVTRMLEGVSTFNQFSGGDTTSVSSPNDAVAQGPGKLYVSEDGMTVTFSTSNIITPDIVNLIRDTPTDFMVSADQFSSIYDGMFNLTTNTATVTLPGGGVIWSSMFNNSRDALYVDNEGVSNQIQQTVSSLLQTTKSEPAKDSGILHIIFNGREIYSYSPISGNNDFLINSGSSFDFVNMTISGRSLTGGPYTGYNTITIFDGVEVKQIDSSTVTQTLQGPGLLLLPQDSDNAFYTDYAPAVSYLSASIQILKNFLVYPQIRPGDGSETTKERSIMVDFGTDVTAYEGADVTFDCNVIAGRPQPTVNFYRVISDDEHVLLNNTIDNEIIVGNNTLTLLNVQMDDVGEYVCVASNGVPPDALVSSTLQSVLPAGQCYYNYSVLCDSVYEFQRVE